MNDLSIYAIAALLPLTAGMLILQVNPYHALVLRGILGAIAALVYAVLGAADVALTEALVGTMLAITLYAVAVRSSLVMRLGVLTSSTVESGRQLGQLLDQFRTILSKHHLRLEVFSYTDVQSLNQALIDKEVHTTCVQSQLHPNAQLVEAEQPYHTVTRVQRLYDIMQSESSLAILSYVNPSDTKETH